MGTPTSGDGCDDGKGSDPSSTTRPGGSRDVGVAGVAESPDNPSTGCSMGQSAGGFHPTPAVANIFLVGHYCWNMVSSVSGSDPLRLDDAGRRRRRADLLSEMVAVNSVNPLQAGPRSGPGGEADLAHLVAEHCRGLGAEVTLDEAAPGRPNVYCRFDGSTDRTVAIDVHLDTVGIEHMTDDPFDGRQADGRVYGRGSVDTKATLAVVIEMLESLTDLKRGLRPTLLLVGTVGEETGGFPGAQAFERWLNTLDRVPDQVVVAEPTLCAPVHGHKGVLGLEIVIRGQAAHSSKPELGANAINAAGRVIAALEREHERLVSAPPATEVGTGTLSVTEISGGTARNIIPDRCVVFAGRRVAPGEDTEIMFDELQALVEAAAAPLQVEVAKSDGVLWPGFYQSPDSEIVHQLTRHSGCPPSVATYGTNALAYTGLDTELVVFGPGSIDQAHKAIEWIDIDEMDRCAEVYQSWLSEPA
jgi:acetylornithine deacetylase/succinyl-diaminopimelate desuccinylase-like protein